MNNLRHKDLIKKSQQFFDKKDYQHSLKILSELSDDHTLDNKLQIDVFFLMGNIFHVQGKIGKAIKAFQKVLELNKEHTEAAISLSILYNDIGKYKDGEKVYIKMYKNIKSNPGTGEIGKTINHTLAQKHFELAELYFSFDRFDESLNEFNKCRSLNPERLDVRVRQAKVYGKNNFPNKALEELIKLKTEYPEYMPARIALGLFYYGQGKVIESSIEWERILSLNPSNKEAKMYLSMSKSASETALNC